MFARPEWLPSRRQALPMGARAALVGVTIALLGEPVARAASVAVLFLAFELSGHAVQALVGDYADNAALGLVVLAGTAYLWWVGFPLPGVVAGVAVGGWLLVDGVQHLRYGVSREAVAVPYTHDGGPVTGLVRALLARLLEPFRLG